VAPVAATTCARVDSRAASVGSGSRPGAQRRWLIDILRRPEDRAIAALIGRQFRYDVKFKMAVLAILPLTALYVYQGLQSGGRIYDPFVSPLDLAQMGNASLVYIALIMFPAILKDEIGKSDSFQAAWVFFASPADRTALVLSVRRVLTFYFLVPYLMLLGCIFSFGFSSFLHVLMHLLVLFLASQIPLQFMFLIAPQLPFSMPRGVGDRISLMTFVMVLGPIIMLVLLFLFSRYVYGSATSYIAGTAFLAALVYLLERLLGIRVARKVGRLEFVG
jgi:hypothetical protein